MSKVLAHCRGGGRLFLLVVLLDALEELVAVLATSSNLGNVCYRSSRRSSVIYILSLITPHALSEAVLADKSLSNIEQNNWELLSLGPSCYDPSTYEGGVASYSTFLPFSGNGMNSLSLSLKCQMKIDPDTFPVGVLIVCSSLPPRTLFNFILYVLYRFVIYSISFVYFWWGNGLL